MTDATATLLPLARRCILAGALLMLSGVLLGAFGAHGLQAYLDARQMASYQTGVHYQLLHGLGLLLLGVVVQLAGERPHLRWAARLMLAGVVLFSGSIYLMSAGLPRTLGMVTPLGGVSLVVAWALLAWDCRARRN